MTCFIYMVQGYTDKTPSTLKANGIVGYRLHLTLLDFSREFRLYLLDDFHTLVGLLQDSTSELPNSQENIDLGEERELVSSSIVLPTDSLTATYSKDSRDVTLHILHDNMRQILQSLNLFLHQRFAVHVSEWLWCCHLIIAFYSCDTPKGKYVSSVKLGYSCTRCLARKEDIAALHQGATQVSCKMECIYNASKTLIEHCISFLRMRKWRNIAKTGWDTTRLGQSFTWQALLYAICAFPFANSLTWWSVFRIHSCDFAHTAPWNIYENERVYCLISFFIWYINYKCNTELSRNMNSYKFTL